ncbi:hypothetical protein WHI96_23555 [Pseudonocardia tropica]|uniref:Asp23/Gls24 family envelope stress response protein n=1 Tax=Pseudonocardia tropica TaxID=681289 RepID=A0ABV1K0P4_9PSEU
MSDDRPDHPDPELLARLVEDRPAVAGLTAGEFGGVATYLPGRRVRGVRIGPDTVEIAVVGRYPATVPKIDRQVRGAVARHVRHRVVHVHVADLALPGDPGPGDAVVPDAARTSREPAGATGPVHGARFPPAGPPGHPRVATTASPAQRIR